MSQTLFNIGDDLIALEKLIDECDGDISDPQVEEAVTAWFAEIGGSQSAKVDGYINLIKRWDMQAAAAKSELEQYRKIAQVRENRIMRLKQRLKEHMEHTHQQKIETVSGRTVAIQNNGGLIPMEIDPDVNPQAIPEKFRRIVVELNTTAVRAALSAGETLPFARLGQRGTQLRIR